MSSEATNVKVYRAYASETSVWVQSDSGGYPLDPRTDVVNHSPSGLSWGFGGSGPAQLALAVLCDHLGDDDLAKEIYQQFKWDVIAKAAKDEAFNLSSEAIDHWLVVTFPKDTRLHLSA